MIDSQLLNIMTIDLLLEIDTNADESNLKTKLQGHILNSFTAIYFGS